MTADPIAQATAEANAIAQAFIDSGDATCAERAAIANDFRAAVRRLREINGGNTIVLPALAGGAQ